MPELPEVETVAVQLHQKIAGLRIRDAEIFQGLMLKSGRKIFEQKVPGERIEKVFRRGKYLGMVSAGDWILWIHLGMTGRLLWQEKAEARDPHLHLRMSFEGKTGQLFFRDPRRFGKMILTGKDSNQLPSGVRSLGPEPLEIGEEDFVGRYKPRKGRIKSLLLNQQLVAGIGNIYADESLFRAQIDPRKRPHRLSRGVLGRLHSAVQQTLQEAIAAGGSTIDDYRQTDGTLGNFQNRHQVYGREGRPCASCGLAIRRVVLAGRSSFFCPQCQK